MLESKLSTGTSRTKRLHQDKFAFSLFWMSQCVACSPAWRILYHVTASCKGPIHVHLNCFLPTKAKSSAISKFITKCDSSFITKSGGLSLWPRATAFFLTLCDGGYYKVRQLISLQCPTTIFITKCDSFLLQSATAFLLQSATMFLLKSGERKCYYKLRRLLHTE